MTDRQTRLATFQRLRRMADDARPQSDAEWGSERQVSAENSFFREVEAILPPTEFRALEDYCLKATSDERIDEAMLKVAEHYSREAQNEVGAAMAQLAKEFDR
jgi:hypothetical protein